MLGLGHALTLALAPQGAGGTPLPPPHAVTVWTGGSYGFRLTWVMQPDTLVKIQRQLAGGDWSSPVDIATVDGELYEVSGLSSDTAYDVRLRSEFGIVVSEWVMLESIYTGGSIPPEFSATTGEYGSILVTWNPSGYSGIVSSVRIYAEVVFSGIDPALGSYTLYGLTPGVQFNVCMTGFGVSGSIEGSITEILPTYSGAGRAPSNVYPPVITASGPSLDANQGNWNPGDPSSTSYSYQWTADGSTIVGATSAYYTAIYSAYYRFFVTATNAVASIQVGSNELYIEL